MSREEVFTIKCDSIYRYGRRRPEILSQLAIFLSHAGQWKGLSELYKIYKEKYDFEPNNEPIVESPSLFNEMELNGFYFGDGKAKYYTQTGKHERSGVHLDQAYPISYENPSFQKYFRYFFAFMFLSIEWREEFLQFHLEKSFSNNHQAYLRFLRTVEIETTTLIKPGIELWNLWIKDNLLVAENPATQTASGGENHQKDIHINKEYVTGIFEALNGRFTIGNGLELMSALKGEKLFKKLVFAGDAKKLTGAFYSLQMAGLITDPKEKLAAWLADNFQSTFKNVPKDLNLTTVLDYLKGQENPSSKLIPAIEKLAKEYKKSIPI